VKKIGFKDKKKKVYVTNMKSLFPKEIVRLISEYCGDVLVAFRDIDGKEHIIQRKNVFNYLSSCSDDKITRHILSNEERYCVNYTALGYNESDLAVDYLIRNPEKIRPTFSCNQNTKAVKFLITHRWTHMANIFFSENENDLAVHFLVNNPGFIHKTSFSQNRNDSAVSFLIHHPEYIWLKYFANNTNDMAVEYIINRYFPLYHHEGSGRRDMEKFLENFSKNTNDIAVDFLIQYPEYIHHSFEENKNDKAVAFIGNKTINFLNENDKMIKRAISYVIFHIDEHQIPGNLSENKNDHAVRFLIRKNRAIDWNYFSKNPNPIVLKYFLEYTSLRYERSLKIEGIYSFYPLSRIYFQ
jgi:hypothetical protein